MQWIIDGSNLMYRIPSLRRLLPHDADTVRQRLVAMLAALLGAPEVDEIIVVFDGRGDRISRATPTPGITLVYSPAHLSADAVIERLAVNAANPARCRVVSSDRLERDAVRAAGAESMACGDFIPWLEQQQQGLNGWLTRRRHEKPPPTLGDRFPSA